MSNGEKLDSGKKKFFCCCYLFVQPQNARKAILGTETDAFFTSLDLCIQEGA